MMINVLRKAWHIFENILHRIAVCILGIFKITIPEEKWAALMQFVKFAFVGLMNTFIDYFSYLIALNIFNALGWFGDKAYIPSNFIGLMVSVTSAYYWNGKYVFKKEDDEQRSIVLSYLKTVSSYLLTGLVLKTILLYVFITVLGISDKLAPVIILLIVVPINFVLNKLWAFRSKQKNN